ncbi:glycoside hydrolase family 16 protein [Zhihengliuella halotolerans]|uniref:Beta-glucanase (GH16 family) n=1 Tax=Zhihengliuella halotolerans TaxID=370736 RepID=A0A4Q8AGS8_9MICC|nr:glycoside hydrolase family 16 protein [Zhihengliuella halotolerans]RZU63071.1 beta-glucanase (GH16 family) [Zhihengliuella halotolerans]
MKRTQLTWVAAAMAVALLSSTAASAQATETPPDVPSKPGYTLDFAEEFNGTSLDTERWYPYYLPHWVEPENMSDTAARYTVSDGTIKLRVEEDQPPWNPDQDGTVVSSAIQTFNAPDWHKFNGSAVNRNDQTNFNGYTTKYGYVETRAKLSNAGGGGHQAVWLVGTDTSTTAQPEIDFIETFFSTPDKWRIAAYGWGDPDFLSSWAMEEVPVSGTPTEEFHVYGMDWTPWGLKFYYDGELVKTINDAPNQPMGFVVNIYTGAGSGAPNDVWPKQWEVDYLRVFKDQGGYSEDLSSTWKVLANRHLPGYLNIEPNDGVVRFGDVPMSYWSAHWVPETIASGDIRLRNRWTNEFLYLDDDTAKHGTVSSTQTSADWQRTEINSTWFRLNNRAADGAIHVENNTGYPEFGLVPSNWWSSHWTLKPAPAA